MEVVPPSEGVFGLAVHVLCEGAPLHEIATAPESVESELSRSGYIALVPLLNATVVGPDGVSVKSTPIPASVAVCVPEGALSVSVTAAATGPAAIGAKTICKAHAAPTASVLAQVVVAIVNPAPTAKLEIASGRPPLLVSVSV